MKKTIRCSKCSLCAVFSTAGFIPSKTMHCSQFGCHVSDDDGCTMGIKGKPFSGAVEPYTVLADHAAVYGYPLE